MAELLSSDVGFTNRDEYKDKPEWYFLPKGAVIPDPVKEEEQFAQFRGRVRELYPNETPEHSMDDLRRSDASEMPNLLAKKKAEEDAIRAEAQRRIDAEGGIDKVAAKEKAVGGMGGRPPADYKTPAERIQFFKDNRPGFQEYLFKDVLKQNPFEIDPVAEARKADAELPALFNHVFRGKLTWSDRETMTKKQRDFWIQSVQKFHADVEEEATNKKKMAVDKYNFFMNQYDNQVKHLESVQKKIDEAAGANASVYVHKKDPESGGYINQPVRRAQLQDYLSKGWTEGHSPVGVEKETKLPRLSTVLKGISDVEKRKIALEKATHFDDSFLQTLPEDEREQYKGLFGKKIPDDMKGKAVEALNEELNELKDLEKQIRGKTNKPSDVTKEPAKVGGVDKTQWTGDVAKIQVPDAKVGDIKTIQGKKSGKTYRVQLGEDNQWHIMK